MLARDAFSWLAAVWPESIIAFAWPFTVDAELAKPFSWETSWLWIWAAPALLVFQLSTVALSERAMSALRWVCTESVWSCSTVTVPDSAAATIWSSSRIRSSSSVIVTVTSDGAIVDGTAVEVAVVEEGALVGGAVVLGEDCGVVGGCVTGAAVVTGAVVGAGDPGLTAALSDELDFP